jgi:hypothetical protein
MGDAIQVFLKAADIPTVDEWNSAIKAEGFDLILDLFDLRIDDGYRPAMLKGAESGFEWYLSPVATAEELPQFPFKAHIGECDFKAVLIFTSYADEDVAASIAGAVLAKLTGGYYWNPETENKFLQGNDALVAARKIVLEWKQRVADQQQPVPPILAPPAFGVPEPPLILEQAAQPSTDTAAVVRRYRICCAVFVAVWLGFVVATILISMGVTDPPLSMTTELLAKNGSAARTQAIATGRENAAGVGMLAALGALFYGFAAFIPRRPWGWSVGRVAVIGMIFPFIFTITLSTSLLASWMKPETKRFFSI